MDSIIDPIREAKALIEKNRDCRMGVEADDTSLITGMLEAQTLVLLEIVEQLKIVNSASGKSTRGLR